MTRSLEAIMADVDAYNAGDVRDPALEAELRHAVEDAVCERITETIQNSAPIPINAEGQRIVLNAIGIDPDATEIVACPITEEDVALHRLRWKVKRPAQEFTIDIKLGREDNA